MMFSFLFGFKFNFLLLIILRQQSTIRVHFLELQMIYSDKPLMEVEVGLSGRFRSWASKNFLLNDVDWFVILRLLVIIGFCRGLVRSEKNNKKLTIILFDRQNFRFFFNTVSLVRPRSPYLTHFHNQNYKNHLNPCLWYSHRSEHYWILRHCHLRLF